MIETILDAHNTYQSIGRKVEEIAEKDLEFDVNKVLSEYKLSDDQRLIFKVFANETYHGMQKELDDEAEFQLAVEPYQKKAELIAEWLLPILSAVSATAISGSAALGAGTGIVVRSIYSTELSRRIAAVLADVPYRDEFDTFYYGMLENEIMTQVWNTLPEGVKKEGMPNYGHGTY